MSRASVRLSAGPEFIAVKFAAVRPGLRDATFPFRPVLFFLFGWAFQPSPALRSLACSPALYVRFADVLIIPRFVGGRMTFKFFLSANVTFTTFHFHLARINYDGKLLEDRGSSSASLGSIGAP